MTERKGGEMNMTQLRVEERGIGWKTISIPGIGNQDEPPPHVIEANLARIMAEEKRAAEGAVTGAQSAPTRQRTASRPPVRVAAR